MGCDLNILGRVCVFRPANGRKTNSPNEARHCFASRVVISIGHCAQRLGGIGKGRFGKLFS
jgi:hypothetical protein